MRKVRADPSILKRRLHRILEGLAQDTFARTIQIGILALIALNVASVVLETVPSLAARYNPFFRWFEAISVILFTVELSLRVWSVTSDARYADPVWGRVRYMLTPLALVDLVAILPFYLPFLLPVDLRFMRALRMVRLFRLFKISRYSQTFSLLGKAFRSTKTDLAMAVTVLLLLLLMSSSLVYFFERGRQPGAFTSIPETMWWMIALLTPNVGTNIHPITLPGRILSMLIAILGFGVFALPAGILATGLAKVVQKEQANVGGVSNRHPTEEDLRNSPMGNA